MSVMYWPAFVVGGTGDDFACAFFEKNSDLDLYYIYCILIFKIAHVLMKLESMRFSLCLVDVVIIALIYWGGTNNYLL